MAFDFLTRIGRLTPANLSVREQARLAENPLDLRWPGIFPRIAAESIRLSTISTVDFRPTGGRREFNAQGREVPEVLGPQRNWEMTPINFTHHIDERRLQLLREPGIQSLVERGVVKDVDRWAGVLSDAVVRDIEREAFQSWLTNSLTITDPKTGQTVTVAMNVAAARYVTEGTAWNGAVNAYDRLVFHIGQAVRFLGSLGAIRMRQATIDEVVADAPTFNNIAVTPATLEARLSQEGYGQIRIVIDERTYDAFTDGGSAYAPAFYVPTGKVGFQPANGRVGNTHFAPVTRADEFLGSAAAREEVRNNVVVFYREKNDGKTLLIESQANAVALPEEQFTYVVDALV